MSGDVKLLTTGEVAALFRVDPKSVARWAAAGRLLSARTPGTHHRFFAVEVHALMRGETPERARELAEAQRAAMPGGRS